MDFHRRFKAPRSRPGALFQILSHRAKIITHTGLLTLYLELGFKLYVDGTF